MARGLERHFGKDVCRRGVHPHPVLRLVKGCDDVGVAGLAEEPVHPRRHVIFAEVVCPCYDGHATGSLDHLETSVCVFNVSSPSFGFTCILLTYLLPVGLIPVGLLVL